MGYSIHIFGYLGFSTVSRRRILMNVKHLSEGELPRRAPICDILERNWAGKSYSTTAILLGMESGIHRRPRASRTIWRTDESAAGIGKTAKTSTLGLKRTNLFAPAALSWYQILPVESMAMPYGWELFPDGLGHILNFLSARVSRPRRPPPESVK